MLLLYALLISWNDVCSTPHMKSRRNQTHHHETRLLINEALRWSHGNPEFKNPCRLVVYGAFPTKSADLPIK